LGLGEDKNWKKEVEAKGVLASSAQKWKGDSRKRVTATNALSQSALSQAESETRT
jgi:hypothetical protein